MAEGTSSNDIDAKYRSRKENGRYVIPWGGGRPSASSIFKWYFGEPDNSGVRGTWKNLWRFKDEELEKDLPVIFPDSHTLNNPPEDALQVTWIGHATVLVQMDGLNILTDPVFNDYCGPYRLFGNKRYRPLPCTVAELPDIDAVIISHNHYDHLDHTSVKDLDKKFGSKISWYVPMGIGQWLKDCGCENVKELEWWEEGKHSKGSVSFHLTPSQHWCRRTATDENVALWGSWSIVGTKHRFFFGGDSGYCDVFKLIGQKFGPFDLAAIPIGAYEPRWFMKFQHTDPQDAVKMHKDLKAKHSVAIHWGTFALAN
ncbi:hypothetical protein QZH41_015642, partial [Actinostola sp. cb2023]